MVNKTNVVRSLICVSMGFIVSQLAMFAQGRGAAAASPATQTPSAAAANPPAQLSIAPQAGESAYQGSVPQGTASPSSIPLTLADAVNRGLKANLGLLTSEQSSRQTRAERYR